jgi:TonB family protein
LNKGVEGDVVLDILLSPAGEVRQFVVVESPGESLTRAAEASLRKGRFEAARVGKYAIWSWLRVTTAFNLEG